MGENLVDALEITVIGMTLVFGAIFLLWGVMSLLVRLTADGPEAEEEAPEAEAVDAGTDRKRRAAAAAVAVALAREHDHTLPHAFPIPPTPIVSAWQAVMRGRQLKQRGPIR
ncbi:MAG TPA: OadG family protein [Aggregatilinea sp.]|jgi:Na+-transporting methylmalonyl-CoA/oxaloacetate decarboxylase gamma subunit|uniref:OadG family protein n=1 Tax=Aggregatilinea sp. TaxID=2806333 RepID=UPI002CFAEA66|nr:OadG family protein [Aggregatilinea sp.]HML22935.1 OadG family protein [Aggregatilinea sp.]